MQTILQKAQNHAGMALINLIDASRKVEVASIAPLGMFGVGGMIDVLA
jgi:hypothetical protein